MENTNSINRTARIGGVLYLIIIVAGVSAELFIRNKLIIPGNATTTANNIMASQLLWRMGIACDLLMHICDVPLIVVLYVLLKPVNKHLALLAMLFTLIQSAVMVATKLNLLMPIFLLGNADYLKSFEADQLQTLMYLSIKSDGYGFGLGLIFFGITCVINGYLIFRSTYFPKVLGLMLQVAGLCYLVNSFTLILAPGFADAISPAILLPCFIAEVSFCFWLIAKGVNLRKWKERAS